MSAAATSLAATLAVTVREGEGLRVGNATNDLFIKIWTQAPGEGPGKSVSSKTAPLSTKPKWAPGHGSVRLKLQHPDGRRGKASDAEAWQRVGDDEVVVQLVSGSGSGSNDDDNVFGGGQDTVVGEITLPLSDLLDRPALTLAHILFK